MQLAHCFSENLQWGVAEDSIICSFKKLGDKSRSFGSFGQCSRRGFVWICQGRCVNGIIVSPKSEYKPICCCKDVKRYIEHTVSILRRFSKCHVVLLSTSTDAAFRPIANAFPEQNWWDDIPNISPEPATTFTQPRSIWNWRKGIKKNGDRFHWCDADWFKSEFKPNSVNTINLCRHFLAQALCKHSLN
jgi:hypothetical protein